MLESSRKPWLRRLGSHLRRRRCGAHRGCRLRRTGGETGEQTLERRRPAGQLVLWARGERCAVEILLVSLGRHVGEVGMHLLPLWIVRTAECGIRVESKLRVFVSVNHVV